jgi:hypothetical protein
MAKNDSVQINLEEVKVENAEIKSEESVIEIDDSSVKDKKVKVRIAQDSTFYHGDRWYELKKDETLTVTQGLKEWLQSMGLLSVL